ncbi:phage tail protein [Roseomonas terrae]|uniref:Phage tail protein n=1 Tax=Neoroseomonas terrae TaxID=424799 RepID=A0ABS5EHD7_9PROT|nr:portal protein [Neoroseomonas terrae]MBR0650436.1 phage tail protein [Neoroseomonas terrae]
MTPEDILARHARAIDQRRAYDALWQDCYDHVLPAMPAERVAIYDATAADAAEQLAASLLAELTPPWSRWFGLAPGRPLEGDAEASIALEEAAETLQGHLDRSNFTLEMHQAFLDLVIAGTGVLLVEEAPPGEPSALRFTAVPLGEAVLEEGPSGRLDTVYRAARLTEAELRRRYPAAPLPPASRDEAEERQHRVVEAVWPDCDGTRFMAIAATDAGPVVLAEGRFSQSPFIAFRWLKAPGEIYGRGPVAKALPDIRTANKVVELVLKNASIAATGIWQADDDGVLNPATVRLEPGAIIPKAPGSSGLTPLAAPGNFDVSQLVLTDLRARIRGALLADRLGPQRKDNMTATEVLERAAETARLLGATYGRLQSELLTPLVARCLGILRRRGEIPPLLLDGREAVLRYRSPLAQVQGRTDAANTLLFLQAVRSMGDAALAQVDLPAAARWLGRTLSAPAEILLPPVQADKE